MKKLFLILTSYFLLLSVIPVFADTGPASNDTYYCHGKKDANGIERCIIAENGKNTTCPDGWTKTPNTISCKCGPTSSNPDDECIQLDNPLESETTDIPTLIGVAIKALLSVVGAVTLLMFFWGARNWVMAAGNAEKIKSGTETMVWAVIGTIIVFASYVLVDFIIKAIGA